METNNIIIQNFAQSLVDAAIATSNKAVILSDNADENAATIKTMNVLLESVRSQTVLLQQAIDAYKPGV